jgi:Ser/Thr protein kinase RdoA (MazF antagonist)
MGGDRFVLKIYGDGWKAESAIRWEVELLDHLSCKGVKVAKAVVGVGGEAVRTIGLDGVSRSAVLFEYAMGDKPKEPFTLDLYHNEGRAVAAMHSAGDDFASKHERQALDLGYLIDRPIRDASGLVEATEREFLARFADYLHRHIDVVSRELDWGPVHGDMTLDNFHVANDGEIYFYDFDSGGMGWRASDIQGWAIKEEDRPKQQAFLEGYREVRNLSQVNEEASPYMHAAWEVWGLSNDFIKRVGRDGEQAIQKYLADQMVRLKELERSLREREP